MKESWKKKQHTDFCGELGENISFTVDFNRVKHMVQVLLEKHEIFCDTHSEMASGYLAQIFLSSVKLYFGDILFEDLNINDKKLIGILLAACKKNQKTLQENG